MIKTSNDLESDRDKVPVLDWIYQVSGVVTVTTTSNLSKTPVEVGSKPS